MTRAAPAALAFVLLAAVWGVMHVGWYAHGQITDYGEYQMYGDNVVKYHKVPYRDIRIEYPPAALPAFVVPSLLERFDYRRVFQILMFFCDFGLVLGVGVIARTESRRRCGGRAARARLGRAVAVRPLACSARRARGRGAGSRPARHLGASARHGVRCEALAGRDRARRTSSGSCGRRDRARHSPGPRAPRQPLAAWFLPFIALSPGGTLHSLRVTGCAAAPGREPRRLRAHRAPPRRRHDAPRDVELRLAERHRAGCACSGDRDVDREPGRIRFGLRHLCARACNRRAVRDLRGRLRCCARRVREGLLAPVHDLARPVRAARAGLRGVASAVCSSRRSC